MKKLYFYITLCLITILSCYYIVKVTDYSTDQNFIRDNSPTYLKSMVLNLVIPMEEMKENNHSFIVGTSHVSFGFDACKNESIQIISEFSMTAESSFRIANALLNEAFIKHQEKMNLILEVTLIEGITAQSQKNITPLSDYVLDGASIINQSILNTLNTNKISCLEEDRAPYDEKDLNDSIAKSTELNDLNIKKLFSQYERYLEKLIKTCENTHSPRITLVSLPIHPDLYSHPNVKNTFQTLESNVAGYLKKIQHTHSCNISYLNLTALGADFPEKQFWRDAGHFYPYIGSAVLKEIEAFHSNHAPIH